MSTNSGDYDMDESLFGSPPQSPRFNASPCLALPGGPDCIQNVGTIALPGPHNLSELPVCPPASSLSEPQLFFDTTPRASTTSESRGSRAPVQWPTQAILGPSRSRPSEGRRRIDAPTHPRQPPPPIRLPQANEELPPHFLRNQEALLGHAGLVGGVHPASLPQPHTRGFSRDNPIVIEEGRRNSHQPIAPPRLTQTQVLAALVKNKEAVAVLSSILHIVARSKSVRASSATQSMPNSSERGDDFVPRKRRKVGGLAGAGDWDVCHTPCEDSAQDTIYTKEHTKHLIVKLVGHIQEAARRATEDEVMKQHGHYRPSRTSPLPSTPVSSMSETFSRAAPTMVDHTAASLHYPSPFTSDHFPQAFSQDLFGDLMASLDFGLPPIEYDSNTALQSFEEAQAQTSISGDTSTSQQSNSAELDDLVALLRSFQPAPGAEAQPMDIDGFNANNVPQPGSGSGEVQTSFDFAIDPVLLAMSSGSALTESPSSSTQINSSYPTNSSPSASVTVSSTPGLLPSPLASTSSLADPATPRWDAHFPEPHIATSDSGSVAGEYINGITSPLPLLNGVSTSTSYPHCLPTIPAPPAIIPVEPPTQPTPTSLLLQSSNSAATAIPVAAEVSSEVASTWRRADVAGPGRPSNARTAERKVALFARAKARKQQLELALERAKIELWEVTLEQGALSYLVNKEKL